jgi:uncharacterized protein
MRSVVDPSSIVSIRRRALLGGALAFTTVSALAQGYKPKPEPFPEGLLWRVVRKGAPDSFVFGTIHVADARVSEVPEPVADALKRARRFATELDLDGIVDPRVFELEQYRDGRKLVDLIGPEAFARVQPLLAAQNVPERVLERMKPWAALLAITKAPPRGEAVSLDQNLAAAARALKLKPMALEWVEEQIAAFDSIPPESQVALLKQELDVPGYLGEFTEPAIQAWLARSLAGLAAVNDRIAQRYPDLARHNRRLVRAVIENRTVLMKHRLTLPLRSGGVFVAVGALHLYGSRGLLAGLVADGYRLERLW